MLALRHITRHTCAVVASVDSVIGLVREGCCKLSVYVKQLGFFVPCYMTMSSKELSARGK